MIIQPFTSVWRATRKHKYVHAAIVDNTVDVKGIRRVTLSILADKDFVIVDPNIDYITILTDRDLNELWN